jgi:hypothetical protein
LYTFVLRAEIATTSLHTFRPKWSHAIQKYTKFAIPPLLRFRSALHCGYSGITDIQDGLFFVLTCATTFKKSYGQVRDSQQQQNIRENIQYFHSRPLSLSVIPL